jgi:glycine cleavage system regulatory protein
VQHSIVLTLVGPDRPGLVEAVSEVVAQHGGNWVESRMAQLGGQFAGILRVELAPAQVDSLRQSLLDLSSANLQVVVVPVDASEPKSDRRQLQLDLIGQDRPGIVKEISQVLTNWNVNLEDLHTECISAPMSGEKLFVATARLSMPDDVQMNAVCSALERIAADLVVDITLAPPSKSNVKRLG